MCQPVEQKSVWPSAMLGDAITHRINEYNLFNFYVVTIYGKLL
jgi:hypothetical protein